MKKQIKKLLCAALSLTMVAGSIVLPATASAEDETTDLKSWKFDFGAAESTPETGYTLVTPDVNYIENTSGEDQYGFLGIDENSYKLGARLDGFDQQEGQIIELEAGGGTGLNDGIGSVGADEYGNAGDKYYPVRFALKVEDETYYKIKATVTTLDPTKDAIASLYTERKHPLYTEKTITAGESVTTEFTIRVTPIYYEKSDPKGAAADGMVNVCVLGENTALAALEIQQLETAPTLWVVGDSTVTDSGGTLPFNPMQNYTGVGTGLTKYLPSNIAMVNEGEGGLNANDNNHFNMISSRIKAGDYMYVEYGHNHKNSKLSDGTMQMYTGEYWLNNYLQALPKYYNACKGADGGEATLIVVGPIDRHNESQYTGGDSNIWTSTLNGFSNIGKQYVDCLRYGGETVAASFLAKWTEIASYAETNKTGNAVTDETKLTELNALKADADKIVSGAIAGGTTEIDNVAFVDLNQPSLDWYTTLTGAIKQVTVKDETNGETKVEEFTNERRFTDYYFTTLKNDATDGTHPNDVGAENLAYFFFTTSDKDRYPALLPLLANFEDGAEHEEPTPVSDEVIRMGWAGTSDAWPSYQPPIQVEYPIVIRDVKLNENNEFVNLTAYVQASFSNYALGVVDIYDAQGEFSRQIVTAQHVDNTTGKGTNVLSFGTDNLPALADGETYKAYMWSCDMTEDKLIPEEEGGEQLSSIYTPTEIDAYILPGENGGTEDFDHYNQTTLDGSGKYLFGGSAGHDLTLGKADEVNYTRIMSDGAKNGSAGQGSFYVMRPLENLVDDDGNNIGTGNTGRYMIDVDVMYTSGGGLNFAFCENTTPTKSPFVSNQFTAFGIGNGGAVTVNGTEVGAVSGTSWTNIKYILDMNAGTAEIAVAGGTPVTVDVPDYKTFATPSVATLKHFILEGQKVAFDIKLSNLTVAKLKDSDATATLNVSAEEIEQTSVYEVTANADADYSDAALIVAAYKDDDTLDAVTVENKMLVKGENKFEVEAKDGIQIMLWDSLDTLKPINMTAQLKKPDPISMGTVYVNEKGSINSTVAQGSTVTAYAVPNEGYVFVKWVDADGKDFSTEKEVDVRLYKDLSLTAHFALQKGAESVTDYKVAADKTSVKTGEAQTVTVSVSDVVDEDGNPVKYSDSDITWSSDNNAVSVTGGAVTIPADYESAAFRDTVTITATLNNISKNVKIKLYSCDYYEDFSAVEDADSWITNTSTNPVNDILDTSSDTASFAGMTAAGNGKVLVIGNNGNGADKMFEYTKTMGFADKTKLNFGFDIEPNQIRFDGKTSAATLQFVDTDGTKVFDISVKTDGGKSLFNGTEVNGFTAGTAVTVDTTLDFVAKTMTYTLTDSTGKVLTSGTADITALNLDRMYFSGDWNYGKFAIDNVYADYITE